jgi:hypothetical protein
MELVLGFGLLALWAWVLVWCFRTINPKRGGWSIAGLVFVSILWWPIGFGLLVYALVVKGRRARGHYPARNPATRKTKHDRPLLRLPAPQHLGPPGFAPITRAG